MIQIQNLHKTYGRGRHSTEVLHGVSFTLPETGFICILGSSGCGKTSLLNAIGGLDTFQSGSVSTGTVTATGYGSRPYERERNRNFGYVFQNYYLLPNHSVGYNVYMGLHALDLSHREKLRRVHEALKAVQMDRFFRRNVADLSGGQQQRVAIARALARRPRVIFADEPTGNLDESNTMKICALLKKISQQSLVVVVTHETSLARVFADRIITLDQGMIQSDTRDFSRESLQNIDTSIYAGDYVNCEATEEGVRLRFLRQPDAPPVEVTIVSQQDQIILSLKDQRKVTLNEVPILEGRRPVLSMESLMEEAEGGTELFSAPVSETARSGRGLGFRHIFQEARTLLTSAGARGVGTMVFLVLLSLMTLLITGDYLNLRRLDPEDFITCDSHILEVTVDYGSEIAPGKKHILQLSGEYMQWLRENGEGFRLIPAISGVATYSSSTFRQMDQQTITFSGFSYLPMDLLEEDQILYGRMPENSQEIVVDRWILEKALREEGILQNNIPDITFFLGTSLTYAKESYQPTIVGICDTGSPVLFMDEIGLISLAVGNRNVMTLSQLQAQYPGKYDSLTLEDGSCAVNLNRAGVSYRNQIGGRFQSTTRTSYTIATTIEEEDLYSAFIVPDTAKEDLLWDVTGGRFFLYCPDKTSVQNYLATTLSPYEEDNFLLKTVSDNYTATMNTYVAASSLDADARTIVTVTVLVLSMVMLYLLCRAQAHSRIGMVAVYRLLGVPRRVLLAIFLMETILLSFMTALPASILCYGVVHLCQLVPQWNIPLYLPFSAVGLIYGFILLYHICVSLLPLMRLLQMPPAQLAAKYDL